MDTFDEAMDTNEGLESYYEEGEINSSDDDDDDDDGGNAREEAARTRGNVSSAPGRNIKIEPDSNLFDKGDNDESWPEYDRPRGFGVPINLENTSDALKKQLSDLYKDLGIDKENERHYRFNTIHMRGTEKMSTKDVFQYFASNAPTHVEWINSESCNVVWLDDLSAAKVLLNSSRPIKNLDKVADPFKKENETETMGEDSVVGDAVDARDIKMAIPPGCWRLGEPAKNSPYILLRYATQTEKKLPNAEKYSDYYRKYGNPHVSSMPGLLSKSFRNELESFKNSSESWSGDRSVQNTEKSNPWVELAYNWGRTDQVERPRYYPDYSDYSDYPEYPEYPDFGDARIPPEVPDLRLSLRNRMDRRKRPVVAIETSHNSQEAWETRPKVPRMKMYADDEEEKLEANSRKSAAGRRHKPMEDLRSKIDRIKSRERFKVKTVRKQQISHQDSQSSHSDSEYDDGHSGGWALEQYSSLRESVEQRKRPGSRRLGQATYDSESEESEGSDSDDVIQYRNGQRSPLQIEIDNDEYYQRRTNN